MANIIQSQITIRRARKTPEWKRGIRYSS